MGIIEDIFGTGPASRGIGTTPIFRGTPPTTPSSGASYEFPPGSGNFFDANGNPIETDEDDISRTDTQAQRTSLTTGNVEIWNGTRWVDTGSPPFRRTGTGTTAPPSVQQKFDANGRPYNFNPKTGQSTYSDGTRVPDSAFADGGGGGQFRTVYDDQGNPAYQVDESGRRFSVPGSGGTGGKTVTRTASDGAGGQWMYWSDGSVTRVSGPSRATGGGGGGQSDASRLAVAQLQSQARIAEANADNAARRGDLLEKNRWQGIQNDIDRQIQQAQFGVTSGQDQQRIDLETELGRGGLQLEAAGLLPSLLNSAAPIPDILRFLEAGGGNIENAIAAGATALTDENLTPAALALETLAGGGAGAPIRSDQLGGGGLPPIRSDELPGGGLPPVIRPPSPRSTRPVLSGEVLEADGTPARRTSLAQTDPELEAALLAAGASPQQARSGILSHIQNGVETNPLATLAREVAIERRQNAPPRAVGRGTGPLTGAALEVAQRNAPPPVITGDPGGGNVLTVDELNAIPLTRTRTGVPPPPPPATTVSPPPPAATTVAPAPLSAADLSRIANTGTLDQGDPFADLNPGGAVDRFTGFLDANEGGVIPIGQMARVGEGPSGTAPDRELILDLPDPQGVLVVPPDKARRLEKFVDQGFALGGIFEPIRSDQLSGGGLPPLKTSRNQLGGDGLLADLSGVGGGLTREEAGVAAAPFVSRNQLGGIFQPKAEFLSQARDLRESAFRPPGFTGLQQGDFFTRSPSFQRGSKQHLVTKFGVSAEDVEAELQRFRLRGFAPGQLQVAV